MNPLQCGSRAGKLASGCGLLGCLSLLLAGCSGTSVNDAKARLASVATTVPGATQAAVPTVQALASPTQAVATPVIATAMGTPSPDSTPTLAPSPRAETNESIDPKSLTLTLQDLPPGFILNEAEGGYTDNAEAARGDQALVDDFNRYGREIGYATSFYAPGAGPPDTSIVVIEQSASVYRTVDGARQLFELRRDNPPSGVQPISVPNLGDQTYGLILETEGNQPTTLTSISILKGRAIISLTTAAVAGGGSLDQSLDLARKAAALTPKPFTASPEIKPAREG